ncbi:hypothetical protein EXE24_08015 [Acinetobacter johnsonii]|jgi:GTP-binding protein EngB required for normal cell division|nr:hypothetical protein EXE24_08015 [Acinetobacter johnsonii]
MHLNIKLKTISWRSKMLPNLIHMSNAVDQVKLLLDSSNIINEEKKIELFDVIEKFNQKKLNSALNVMLFGAYNAGKSTFINTLMAKDVAQVNDIPTTDKVDEYHWNGITICDTPGINAPIEHQQVTDEYLKQIHAIVFILRETDVDAKNLYDRMFEMLKSNKSIFVIFNHQFKMEEQDKCQLIVQRIQENLVNLSSSFNIDTDQLAKINIYPIRLRAACKGAIEGKDALLSKSGFKDFQIAFQNWLDFESDYPQYLQALYNYLNEHLFHVLENNLLEINNIPSELDVLLENKRNYEQQSVQSTLKINNKIKSLVQHSKPKVIEILNNAQSQEQAEDEINTLYLSLQEQVMEVLAEEIEDNNEQNLQKWQANLESIRNRPELKGKELYKTLIENGLEVLSKEQNIKQILLAGRKMKIPGLKGRWEKTLGKWAGKGAIAIQVLMAGYELYNAHSEQENANKEIREFEVARYQIINTVLESFYQYLSEYAEGMLKLTYGKKINEIETSLNTIHENDHQVDKFVQEFEIIKNNFKKFNELEMA